jgi:hypothetical protein
LASVRPVEFHALLARTYPEPPAIVGAGIVPRGGLVVTGGPPKRGKSLLTVQKALARATSTAWLGFPTSPGPTLILQAEIPERELQTRLRIMQAGVAAPPPRSIHFVTDRGLRLDRRENLRAIRTLIETLRPDYVIIDPLARFFSGDENSSRDVGRLVASLDELIQAYGVAIELVHHTAKPSGDDPRAGGLRLRGSTALFAACDSVLLLDRDGTDAFKLSFELRHGAEPAPMRLRRAANLWLEPAAPPEDLLAVAAVVDRLPLGYGMLLAAVQSDLGVKERTAQTLVASARKAGLIAPDGAGTYRTTASYRKNDLAVPAK